MKPLNIPKEHEGCYALAGRMVKDEDILDVVIANMIKLLKAFEKKKKGLLNEEDEAVKDFDDFIASKKKLESINMDITRLYKYLPNLSGGTPVPNVKE